MGVETSIIATVAAPPARVIPIVTDLGTYPEWLSLVTEAELVEPVDGEDGPVWSLTLRAKVGPFARSKRLRMARTERSERGAVFTRAEVDGRDHATWRMTTSVAPSPSAGSTDFSNSTDSPDSTDSSNSTVTTELFYDGSLWSGPLEAILRSEAELAEERLGELVRRS